jgi:hypothetical protein
MQRSDFAVAPMQHLQARALERAGGPRAVQRRGRRPVRVGEDQAGVITGHHVVFQPEPERVLAVQPERERRHRHHDVVTQQRNDGVDVEPLERLDVPPQQSGIDRFVPGQRCRVAAAGFGQGGASPPQ